MKEKDEDIIEQELEKKERADKDWKRGKVQRYVCINDCYWDTNRYRPGDIQDFNGDPPENFPKHHFERI